MTCIAGLVNDGVVWIGGDSAGVDSNLGQTTRADSKVFVRGPLLIGFTTSFRMGQLLRFSLDVPKRHHETDIYEWMCTDLVDAIRSCLQRGGFAEREKEREQAGTFLVGCDGRLFVVESDYQVAESTFPFNACGGGYHLALGAMYATRDLGMLPEKRIETALQAASEFNAGVRGPFRFESMPRQSEKVSRWTPPLRHFNGGEP